MIELEQNCTFKNEAINMWNLVQDAIGQGKDLHAQFR